MFAFAKQLVRSAEGIISNPQGNSQGANYDNYRGSDPYGPRSDPTHGFRVIHVLPGSPAFQAGIESLFDFIIGINGHDIVGQQAQVQSQQFQQYEPSYQNNPGLQSINESGPAPFYGNPNSQPNPYAPQQASSAYNYTAESTNPKVHHRGSLSFTSASGIIPQLVPPNPETSPLDPFIAEIANCRGRSISLEVWSSKGRTRRTIVLPVPSLPETSNEKDSQSLGIGMSLQWTSLSVGDHVWHVLNVAPNSPAEAAGLISHSDYIVGAENGMLEAGGEDLLGRVVQKLVSTHSTQRKTQQHQLQTSTTADETSPSPPIVNSQPELELFVYNHEYDTLRAVRIRPTSNWGGSGLLGCGVGYGLLHRLPVKNGQENINTGNGDNFQQVAHRRHFSGSTQPHYEPPLASPTIHEEDEHESISAVSAGGPPSSFFTPANMGTMPSTSAFVPAMSAPPIGPPPMAGASNMPPGPPQLGPPPIMGSQLPPSRKKKHHHYPTVGSTLPPPQGPDTGNPVANNKLNNDLAAYFAEEEQRSKELDGYSYKPSMANSALPPPPPPPSAGAAAGTPTPPPPPTF